VRLPALLLIVAVIAVTVGCASAPPVPTATSTAGVDLIAEARATADRLDEALEHYRAGELDAALDTLADAYENHFELIEDPLEEIDDPFMHQLELLIAVTIRQQMRDGAAVATVQALIEQAKADLATAQEMLR
jgi:endonuclease III